MEEITVEKIIVVEIHKLGFLYQWIFDDFYSDGHIIVSAIIWWKQFKYFSPSIKL